MLRLEATASVLMATANGTAAAKMLEDGRLPAQLTGDWCEHASCENYAALAV